MSIMLMMMREGANRQVCTYKDEDGLFHGIEYVDHPTPSGCERWLPTFSDPKGHQTPEIAAEEFAVIVAQVDARQAEFFREIESMPEDDEDMPTEES